MRSPLGHQTVQHVRPNAVYVCTNYRREAGVLPPRAPHLPVHVAPLVGPTGRRQWPEAVRVGPPVRASAAAPTSFSAPSVASPW